MEDKHSPLPWKTHSIIRPFYTLLDRDGMALGDFALPRPRENSEFIVRACNNHYQLIEALEAIADINEIIYHSYELDNIIKNALKLEKGEQQNE